MKISVIIPTYNEEKYLPYLLDCLTTQTEKPYEVIIADNNSSDLTHSIMKRYSRFLNIKRVKGGFPAIARNNGALSSAVNKNDFLFFMDADIIIKKDFIEKFDKELTERKLDCATCFTIPIYRKYEKGYSNPLIRWVDRTEFFIQNEGFLLSSFMNSPFAAGACIAVRKNYFVDLNGFDTSLKLFEDSDFVRRASRICNYGVIRTTRAFVSMRRFDKRGHILFPIKLASLGFLSLFYRNFQHVQFDYFKNKKQN